MTLIVICCLECSFVCHCVVEMHFLGGLGSESAIVSLSETKATVVVSSRCPRVIWYQYPATEYGRDRGRRCECVYGDGKGSANASYLPF